MLILAICSFIIGHYTYIGVHFFTLFCFIFSQIRNHLILIFIGRPCGIEEAKDYPYLYFVVPLVIDETYYNYRTVCVKECPPSQIDDTSKYNLECLTNSLVKSCKQNELPPYENSVWYYETINFHNVVCIPQSLPLYRALGENLWPDSITQKYRDIASCLSMILFSIFLGALLSLGVVFSMKLNIKVVMWGLFGLMGVCLIILTIFCYIRGFSPKKTIERDKIEMNLTALKQDAQSRTDSHTVFQILAILLTLLLFYYTYYIYKHYKLINLAVYAMKTIQRFLQVYSRLLKLSTVFIFLVGIYMIYWIYVWMFLFSCGSLKEKGHKTLPFDVFEANIFIQIMMVFHAISLIWNLAFFINFIDFLASSMMGQYYFDSKQQLNNQQQNPSAYKESLKITLWHLGTVIKGSVLLLVFGLPRHLLKLSYDYIEEHPGTGLTKALSVIWSPFDNIYYNFLIGMNNNGYCLSALYGGKFLENGILAEQISTYPLFEDRWDKVSNVGSMFIYIARFCVTITTGLIAYLIIIATPYYYENIFSAKAPTFVTKIVIMMFTFICSACIIDIYASLTDSFLICYFIGEGSNIEFQEMKSKYFEISQALEVKCRDETFADTLEHIDKVINERKAKEELKK